MQCLNPAVTADHRACALTGLATARAERRPGAPTRLPSDDTLSVSSPGEPVDVRCGCIGDDAGEEKEDDDGEEKDDDFRIFVRRERESAGSAEASASPSSVPSPLAGPPLLHHHHSVDDIGGGGGVLRKGRRTTTFEFLCAGSIIVNK